LNKKAGGKKGNMNGLVVSVDKLSSSRKKAGKTLELT